MNSAWPSALLLLTAWTARADDADKLRAIGGGVFTKGGVVAEINLNRSKISDDQLKLVAGFEHLTDLSLEQTKIGDTGLAHLTGLAKLEWPWFRRLGFGLFAAAAWVGLEMVQARLLGGYPWNFLGVSQFENLPLIQIASVAGVYGVSFLVVWASVSLLFAVLQIRRSPANPWSWMADVALPLLALGLVCGWGIVRIAGVPASTKKLTVALVQPSIPQQLIWQGNTGDERLAKVLELSRLALATKPDLLLWPEACAPITAERWPEVFDMVKSSGVTLLFGADDVERGADEVRYFNSAVLLTPDGLQLPSYRKRRLVMFVLVGIKRSH